MLGLSDYVHYFNFLLFNQLANKIINFPLLSDLMFLLLIQPFRSTNKLEN